MFDDKAKNDSDSPRTLRFIAPFSLANARSRLDSRSEPATLWAWRGQTRIVVETWQIDMRTVGFTIRHAPKSTLTWDIPMMRRKLRGFLREYRDDETAVIARMEDNPVPFVLESFFALLMGGLVGLWVSIMTLEAGAHLFWIIVGGGFTLLAVTAGILWFTEMHHRRLFNIVAESLQGMSRWDEEILRELEAGKRKRF